MAIKIFQNKDKVIDLDKLIESRMLIQANSGGGKSYVLRKFLEETFDKIPSIVIDVEGEFKTLRQEYEFLLIGNGKEADVQLSLQAAKLYPKKILELNVSTIIDISELQLHDRVVFVKQFLEALMGLPQTYWRALLLILDEIHMFCGQQEKQDSFTAVIDLASRGRKRGFCLVGATQRIAKLHKDVAAECNNIFVGRTGLDIDMARAAELLGFTDKKQKLSLRDLEPGEFYVFGPAINKQVEKECVAKVKTVHPKRGQIIGYTAKPTARIKSMIAKLNELPQEAVKEAMELKDYKKRVAELEKQLKAQPVRKDLELTDATLQLVTKEKNELKNKLEQITKANEALVRQINKSKAIVDDEMTKLVGAMEVYKIDSTRINTIPTKNLTLVATSRKTPPLIILNSKPVTKEFKEKLSETGEVNFGKCERLLYSFLRENSHKKWTAPQVAFMIGYSPTSSSFHNALSKLRTSNLIKGSKNDLQMDQDNPAIAIDGDFNPKNAEKLLGKCEKEIFDILVANPDAEFTKEEIASHTVSNYSSTSSSFHNALSKLSSLGLMERRNGRVALSKDAVELFEVF